MQDELVEAVARALVPVTLGAQEDMYGRDLPDATYDGLTPDWQAAYRGYARAAIAAVVEALREPSEAMMQAGYDATAQGYVFPSPYEIDTDDRAAFDKMGAAIWQAMLSAFLQPEQPVRSE